MGKQKRIGNARREYINANKKEQIVKAIERELFADNTLCDTASQLLGCLSGRLYTQGISLRQIQGVMEQEFGSYEQITGYLRINKLKKLSL